MKSRRQLTELEGTVLGVVWSRQPCTPYRVRREFLDSPSPYWSGSAGSIYPLIQRLEEARLLAGVDRATGARIGREYRLTAAGVRALQAWVGPPVDDMVVAVPPDPLRTRMAFLDVLPVAQRRAVVREARAAMRSHVRLAERYLAATAADGPFATHAARGALGMLRARLDWLTGILEVGEEKAAAPVKTNTRRAPSPRRRRTVSA